MRFCITHLHADHWLGLPGMLKTFDLRGRETPLRVHGPRGTARPGRVVHALRRCSTSYDLLVIELDDGELLERDGYEIEPVAVSHRGPALAYVLSEYDRPGVFDPEAARRAGLTEGPDFGRVQRGETVNGVSPDQVMGPTRPGRKLTISGDTRPCDALREAAHGSDLLIHEATFAIEEAERAHQTGHSTASQAAGVATRCRGQAAGALTISRSATPSRCLRDEAREIFANTVLPRDFDTIEIPYAERGEPELLRWADRDAAAAIPLDGGVEAELSVDDPRA